MPIKFERRCKVCRLSKVDKQLKKRILSSSYYSDYGLESMAQIQRDYSGAFSYLALMNHCKKHISLTQKEKDTLEAKWKGTTTEQTALTATPQAGVPMATKPGYEDEVFNDIIEMGMEKLKNGELKVTTDHLLRAADSKANLSLKRKDQELKIQEMIWHFASGEAEGNIAYEQRIIEGETATTYDAAAVTAENVSRRKTRPSSIH